MVRPAPLLLEVVVLLGLSLPPSSLPAVVAVVVTVPVSPPVTPAATSAGGGVAVFVSLAPPRGAPRLLLLVLVPHGILFPVGCVVEAVPHVPTTAAAAPPAVVVVGQATGVTVIESPSVVAVSEAPFDVVVVIFITIFEVTAVGVPPAVWTFTPAPTPTAAVAVPVCIAVPAAAPATPPAAAAAAVTIPSPAPTVVIAVTHLPQGNMTFMKGTGDNVSQDMNMKSQNKRKENLLLDLSKTN